MDRKKVGEVTKTLRYGQSPSTKIKKVVSTPTYETNGEYLIIVKDVESCTITLDGYTTESVKIKVLTKTTILPKYSLIDEQYDEELDDGKRMIKIVDEIERLSNLTEVELFKLEKQRKDSGVQPILETLEKYLIFAYGVDNFKTNEEIKTYLGYSSALAIKDYRGNILVTFNSNEEGDQNKTTTDYDTVVYFTYDSRVKTWYKKVFKFDFSSKKVTAYSNS
jgi:hypothetical protein